MSRARFRAPPAWAWILTAAAVALFSALGGWQWRRGLAKEALLAQLADRSQAAEPLSAASAPGAAPRRASAFGVFGARQLLQDGQSHRGQPGYHVWTPLRLRDGTRLIVDRGWIPQRGAGSVVPPPPEGEVALHGAWRALPEPGLRLAAANPCVPQPRFPVVVLYPTAADLECLLGTPVLEGLLLMDPALPGGFVREWTDLGVPPQRHYGYAVQWLALAGAVLAVFWAVNRKKTA